MPKLHFIWIGTYLECLYTLKIYMMIDAGCGSINEQVIPNGR